MPVALYRTMCLLHLLFPATPNHFSRTPVLFVVSLCRAVQKMRTCHFFMDRVSLNTEEGITTSAVHQLQPAAWCSAPWSQTLGSLEALKCAHAITSLRGDHIHACRSEDGCWHCHLLDLRPVILVVVDVDLFIDDGSRGRRG